MRTPRIVHLHIFKYENRFCPKIIEGEVTFRCRK